MKDLDAALASDDPETRRLAVTRLAEAGTPALLVRALGDEDWRVRKEAAHAARAMARRADVVHALGDALDDRHNVGLRNAAVEALVLIGRDSVPVAVRALTALDADGRKLAVEVLGGVPDLTGTRALLGALSDPDANVRVTAAEALGAAKLAGDEAATTAVTGLRVALRDGAPALRLSALEALLRLDAKLAWNEIAPLLSEPLLKRVALVAAARCDDDAALAALARTVESAPPALACEAAVALAEGALSDATNARAREIVRGALASKDAAAERIAAWTMSDDGRLRSASLTLIGALARPADASLLARALGDAMLETKAEDALIAMGSAAALPLLTAAPSLSPPGRARAIGLVPELLTRGDPITLGLLRDSLASDAPEIVAASVKAVGLLGDASDLVRAEALVGHADARVAAAAHAALLSLASRMPDEARARAEAISPDSQAAIAACAMLEGCATRSHLPPSALGYLRRALGAGDARTRRAAVDALARASSEEAKDVLALALADEERNVQIAAIRALGVLSHAAPIVTLLGYATDPEIVTSAFRALAEADPERAVVEAKGAIDRGDSLLASAALEAVARLEGSLRDDVVLGALEHNNPEIVRVALTCLLPPLDARAVARLGVCLDHASWEVRRATAELLGEDGTPAAMALLKERYEREQDDGVRDAILDALRGAPRSMHPMGEDH